MKSKYIYNIFMGLFAVILLFAYAAVGNEKLPAVNTAQPTPTVTTALSPAPTEAAVPDSEKSSAVKVNEGEDKLSGCLFIGDSRTVGLEAFSELEADFFCNVGMNVYRVESDYVTLDSGSKVCLDDMLSSKSYDKIFVMLGINEIGYSYDSIVQRYKLLISNIRKAQPDALLFIEANLHVSAERSAVDEYVNNTRIDTLNSKLKAFADNKTIYYIDVNSLFDDDSGALAESCTPDGTHLYADGYARWGDWIALQSNKLING